MIKIRVLANDGGAAKVEFDGRDITFALSALEIKMAADQSTEVKLTLAANVEAEVEASLLSLEKTNHVRISTLDSPRGRFVRTKK